MRSALSIAALVIVSCVAAATVQAQGNLAATPQGKAVLAYYKALRTGDLATIKKCVTAESAKELEGPRGKEMLGILKETTPAAPPAITKVDVKDKTAMVDAKVTEGATTMTEHVRLVMVGTEWKVNTTGK
jgi:hypothetical protein